MIDIPAARLINKPGRSRSLWFVVTTWAIADDKRLQYYRQEHLEYLHSLHSDGCLLGAGPTLNENADRYRGDGMIILKAESLAKAVALADQDPYHREGVRKYRIIPWLLSEGLAQNL
jgi:uncharacterized protein